MTTMPPVSGERDRTVTRDLEPADLHAGGQGRTAQPVFVVGMNGSGTSMMLDCLGRHPALYAVPHETVMMPFIIARADRFGDLSVDENFRAYWQFALDQMPVLRWMTGGDAPAIPGSWSSQPRTIAGVFDGIFRGFAAEAGKRRWCEKTPDHVQHLDTLAEVFQDARFIHLIRDGREVACSLTRRQRRHPELIIYRWKKVVELGRAEGVRLEDRYLEVVYEELTRDPRTQMQRVCKFLDLDFREGVLQSRMPQSPGKKSLAKGQLGTISQNPLKWRRFFDAVTVRRLEQIGGRMLVDLGYDVDSVAGDSNPGRLHRTYWRAIDFLRVTNDRRKKSKYYDSWKKIARKMIFSFKEYSSKRH